MSKHRVSNIPVAGWCDEIEEHVDTVVSKPWVTLDSRLFGQNVVIFALKVLNDLREAAVN
jgi:hypothetical protein